MSNDILLGMSSCRTYFLPDVFLQARYGNRHGMIAGATGTGKTVSLTVMAEGFSRLGVPVFLADVKGDIAGIAGGRGEKNKLKPLASTSLGIHELRTRSQSSVGVLGDIYGQARAIPVRATVSRIGPDACSRACSKLTDVHVGRSLEIVFKLADDNGWLPARPPKDLRALAHCPADKARCERPSRAESKRGFVSATSVAAIQRSLLTLEQCAPSSSSASPSLDLCRLHAPVDMFGPRPSSTSLAADQLIPKPAPLFDVSVVAAVGIVRAFARGRRSRRCRSLFVLRRGASAVRRLSRQRCRSASNRSSA